jgi:GH24 family phage-related lysozyme (muramidase)
MGASGCSPVEPYESRPDKLTPGIFLDREDAEASAVGRSAAPTRKVHQKGLDLTKKSEGFVGRLYNDAARYCTIGYGHLIKKAPCDGTESGTFQDGITEPEGAELLIGDMEVAEWMVASSVPVPLTDGQFAGLCDFVYNVGGRNFRKSTLLVAVNARQHERVPTQLRRWVIAGGKEWPGLRVRREREIELYFDGQPPPDPRSIVPRVGEDVSPIDVRQGELR